MQHDFDIANALFPDVRDDLNDALQALASTNSGGSLPGTTFPGMLAKNTTDDILYIRNDDDDAWAKVGKVEADDTFTPYIGGLPMSVTVLNSVALAALAPLTPAADRGMMFTGASTAALFTLTAAGLALLDDADAAAQRTTLGLAIGTNVQAYDAELAAIAGLTSAADKLPYFTGSGTAALADFTAKARDLVACADEAAMRAFLAVSATPRDFIAGLTMSNNSGTPDTQIDVAAGQATDSTNAETLNFSGGTLDLSTTGANGLRTGTLTANTSYAVFLISGSSGVALMADTSITPGTLPSGYDDAYRYIGQFRTKPGSAAVLGFIQVGRDFFLTAPGDVGLIVSNTTTPSGKTLTNLPLLSGKRYKAHLRGVFETTSAVARAVTVSNGDTAETTAVTSLTTAPLATFFDNGAAAMTGVKIEKEVSALTNTSRQIALLGATANSYAFSLAFLGWTDDGIGA